jgi:hypothetical protein
MVAVFVGVMVGLGVCVDVGGFVGVEVFAVVGIDVGSSNFVGLQLRTGIAAKDKPMAIEPILHRCRFAVISRPRERSYSMPADPSPI